MLATPDLNGDGYQDIIVDSSYGILSGINDGKGNFTYHTLSSIQAIAGFSSSYADFNKDGKDDVVFLSSDSDGYVHLYLGLSNGDGTITAVPQKLPYSPTSAPVISVGDINGDGIPDISLAVNSYYPTLFGAYPMINDGKGNLTAGSFVSTGTSLYGVALADVNQDGKADLVLSYGGYYSTTTSIYLADSTGNFAASPSSVLQNTLPNSNILIKDVTGDGIPDAVLSITNGTNQGIMLYIGKGDGSFNAGTQLVQGIIPYFVDAADLNGDSYPDIFFTSDETVLTDAADKYMGLVVLPGAGNNTFATATHYNIYPAASPVFAVDLVHNGSPSLLASSAGVGTTVLLNGGASTVTLSAATTSNTSTGTTNITVNVAPYYNDQAAPTGYVDLLVDGVNTSRIALAANATATVTLSSLTTGKHVLSATYEGDNTYNVNNHSNTVTLTITKATPSFTIATSNNSLTLPNGGSTSASLSLQANDAFSGPVSLSCAGVPNGATCNFSQSSVTLAPGQTVSSTVTLSALQTASLHNNLPMGITAGSGIALCSLFLLLPIARRRRVLSGVTLMAGLAAVLLGSSGCSSSSPAVTPGTYRVTVNAAPVDNTVATQSVVMLLTVNK